MKTKKISWQAIAIVVLALVLIASIALGVSGAWFQDQDSATSNATLGEAVTVKLADKDTDNNPVVWQKLYKGEAFPGDTILGSTKIMPGSDSPMVLRYKVKTSVKDGEAVLSDTVIDAYTEANMPKYYKGTLEEFKAAAKVALKSLTDNINAGITAAAKWDTDASVGGYYYYQEVVKSTADIELFNTGIQIPTDVTNEAAEWTIEITLTVEAMQAANIKDTANPWKDDLTTTIAGEVDKYNNTERKPA